MHNWLICSEEACFYPHDGHNIQNDRTCSEIQPNELIETPLNDQKIMVWCAFSRQTRLWTLFFRRDSKLAKLSRHVKKILLEETSSSQG